MTTSNLLLVQTSANLLMHMTGLNAESKQYVSDAGQGYGLRAGAF